MPLTPADRERLQALFRRERALRAELRAVRRQQCETMGALLGRGARLLDLARAVAPALDRRRSPAELVRLRATLRKRLARGAGAGGRADGDGSIEASAPAVDRALAVEIRGRGCGGRSRG